MRVLTVTTTPERMANLIKTTQSVENAYFFLFATFEQMKNNNIILDKFWQSPEDNNLYKLL